MGSGVPASQCHGRGNPRTREGEKEGLWHGTGNESLAEHATQQQRVHDRWPSRPFGALPVTTLQKKLQVGSLFEDQLRFHLHGRMVQGWECTTQNR